MRSLFLLFFSSLVTQQCHGFSSSVSVATTTTTTSPASKPKALSDFDYTTENRLPYQKEGYNQWTWRGHQIDYIEMGDPSKPALLLIHGFGASAYHYRYNIPELARNGYHVFAFDMLGFGLSDKPIVDYNAEVWRDQSVDFIQEVIGKPCTIAGNSLGGFTALYASTVDEIKPMIQGTVLLNGAGRFRPEVEEPEETPNPFVERVKAAIQRFVIQCSFIYTKQPARIEQVLRQVYPVNADVVDEELVESIQYPSLDPNAAEVFYREIGRAHV